MIGNQVNPTFYKFTFSFSLKSSLDFMFRILFDALIIEN